MEINGIKNSWKSSLVWILVFFTVISFNKQTENGFFDYTIRSDGSGYYAYLPALFIYQDPTFEKAKQAEANQHQGNANHYFLFKTDDGKRYNKYFPGLAVLQLPFFLLACAFAKIGGWSVDGYSSVFQVFFWIGSLFYCFAGAFLWLRFLRLFFQEKLKKITPVMALVYLATPVVFYSFFTPSFTHGYSLFLVAALFNVLLKLKECLSYGWMALAGILLGLIFLLRPTNIVVVLAVPVFWNSGSEFLEWLKLLFTQHLKKLALLLLCFFMMTGVLLLSWKWQTGKWIVWSYSGEGFDFLHPPLWSTLFSFRTGLFLHAPVFLLIGWGWWYWFRNNRFQAIWWGVYAVVNAWIIFSWWCWDYESPFGNRPFTEHMVLLIIPLFFLLKKIPRFTLLAMVFLGLIGLIRLYTLTTGFMSDQRFTQDNYLESLCFWKEQNHGRWYFTQSCEPHGSVILEKELFAHPDIHEVKPEEEFLFTASYSFPKKRQGERYYMRVTLDKQVLSAEPFDNVFLVIDAAKEGLDHRFYKSIDLFNDKEEGRGEWKSLVFESQVYDFLEEYEQFTVYIWNAGKHRFQLKNVHYSLQVYR